MNQEKNYKTIIAIANSLRNDNVIITEEAICEAAQMHENLSTEKTDQGLALIWKGYIPDKNDRQKLS